jgi:hypothetical protein
LRKKAAFAFNLDQGSYNLGPSYLDSNVAGTRLVFSASYRIHYDRTTDEQEGSSAGARLDYPLFSLASRWGASVSAGYAQVVVRRYDQGGLFPVDLRGTPEVETLPSVYKVRRSSADTSVVRSFGRRVIQRVSGVEVRFRSATEPLSWWRSNRCGHCRRPLPHRPLSSSACRVPSSRRR